MIRFFSFLTIALSLFFLIGCGNWFGDDAVGPEDGTKKIPATGSGGQGHDNGNQKPPDNDNCDTCDSTYTIPEEPIYKEPINQNPGGDTNQPISKDKPVVPDKDLPKDVRNIQLFIEPVTITGGAKEAEFRLSAYGGMGLDRILIGVKKDAKTGEFVIGDGIESDPAGGFQLTSIKAGDGGKAISYRQDNGMIYLELSVAPVLNQVWTICDVRVKIIKTKCFEGGVDPGEFLLISWPSVDNIQCISSTFNIVPNKIENGWIRIKK